MPFIQRSVFFYKAYRLWNPLLIEMLQPRTQSLMSAPRDKAFGTRLEMLHMQDSGGESGTSFTSQMTPGHGNQYTPGSNQFLPLLYCQTLARNIFLFCSSYVSPPILIYQPLRSCAGGLGIATLHCLMGLFLGRFLCSSELNVDNWNDNCEAKVRQKVPGLYAVCRQISVSHVMFLTRFAGRFQSHT